MMEEDFAKEFGKEVGKRLTDMITDQFMENYVSTKDGAVARLMFATAIVNDITLRQAMSRFQVIEIKADYGHWNKDLCACEYTCDLQVVKREKPIRISEQQYQACKRSAMDWAYTLLNNYAKKEKADHR